MTPTTTIFSNLGSNGAMAKRTYYKVVSTITSRKSTIIYAGEVQAYEKPQNKFRSTPLADIYEDYFDTEREAIEFVEKQRNAL